MVCEGCHGGQVHLAHRGLLTCCSMPELCQSLYTGGGELGPCSFEAVGGITIEGRSYQWDRYMG